MEDYYNGLTASTWERINIIEYEAILKNEKAKFSCSFQGNRTTNCQEVGNIWRYAVNQKLGWTAEQALDGMTDYIVKDLKLDKTYPYIKFNSKKSYRQDYSFVLQYAFPGEIKYDFIKETLEIYEQKGKYPKNFFPGTFNDEGEKRARILFLDALKNDLKKGLLPSNLKSLYDYFLSDKAVVWIKRKRLCYPCKVYFNDNPGLFFIISMPTKWKASLPVDDFLQKYFET